MNRGREERRRGAVDLAFPLRVAAGVLFSAIVVLTIAQVFFRFVLGSPLVWSEEVARACVVWVTFIGAAVVCWDGTHLNVDVVFQKIPQRFRGWVRDFNAVVATVFLGAVVYYGLPLVAISNRHVVGSLNMPLSLIRVSGIVGAVLMILFIVLRRFYRRRVEKAMQGAAFDDSNDAI